MARALNITSGKIQDLSWRLYPSSDRHPPEMVRLGFTLPSWPTYLETYFIIQELRCSRRLTWQGVVLPCWLKIQMVVK